MAHALGLLGQRLLHTLRDPVYPLDCRGLGTRPQVVLWARPRVKRLDLKDNRSRQRFKTDRHLFGLLLAEGARVAQVVEELA